MSELRGVIAQKLADNMFSDESLHELTDSILQSTEEALMDKTLSLKAVSHDRRVFIRVIKQVLKGERYE